ncbi:MAG: FAD-dependent monooxygenase [Amylibacter sp.]|nr:FAD-dependent monooxygenase [Amylibacter sp.]
MSVLGKSFGIIGCGIGGVAVSIAIAKLGGHVTLFERAKKITEVGAGIQISANGLSALADLGIKPEHFNEISKPLAIELRDYKVGSLVARIRQNQDVDFPYLQLHRADLMSILIARAEKLGVIILLDAKAKVIDALSNHPKVQANGMTYNFDLIVGADGVNSTTRQDWLNEGPAKFSGKVAWRATVPAKTVSTVTTVYMGRGKHLVMYPLRGGQLINIVAVQECKQAVSEGWDNAGTTQNLCSEFSDFGTDVQQILSQVRQVKLWGLYTHPPLKTWSRNHLTLLGDAAHPMFPFMAQGACMALEDASVLARSLDSTDDINHALKSYEAIRKLRVTSVQNLAARNGKIFHISNTFMRIFIHNALRLISKLTPQLLEKRFDWIYKHKI